MITKILKNIVIGAVLLVITSCGGNSSNYNGLDFVNIEMKGSPDDFVERLVNEKQYRIVSSSDYETNLEGEYYGLPAMVNVRMDFSCVKYVRVSIDSTEPIKVFAFLEQNFNSKYGQSEGTGETTGGVLSEEWDTELGKVFLDYMPAVTSLPGDGKTVWVKYDNVGDPSIEYELTTDY